MTLTFSSDRQQPSFGTVHLQDLSPDLLLAFSSGEPTSELLQSTLRVTVSNKEVLGADLPAVAGRYKLDGDILTFTPHFPFEPGLAYRAVCDCAPIGADPLILNFALPAAAVSEAAIVEEVYPSGDLLPENLLRFYVTFSQPMQRGFAREQVELLGPEGKPATDVLYRAPIELWDREMRQLTVLLDPGRLKRGVGPNRELGPPLKLGAQYTLVIGSGMKSAAGLPLSRPLHKRFSVTEAIREPLDIDAWTLSIPAYASVEPLVLEFGRPLDRALLFTTLALVSPAGHVMGGRIVVDRGERRWSYTPDAPWVSGHYGIRVSDSLEDVCGNDTAGPFDRSRQSEPSLQPVPKRLRTFCVP